MFKRLKGFFGPTNKDLRRRLLFTVFALAIFSLGTNVVVPGAKTITKDLGFLELLNVMTGGGLKTFSIFALGVMHNSIYLDSIIADGHRSILQ